MKPPRGYYSLTEASKVLNLSNAMIRNYVKKDQIHYLQIEGREHGFYLKKDVDELANKLNAFISIGEEEKEEEPIHFTTAAMEDLPGIAEIGNALFAPNSNNNDTVIVPSWRYTLFEKNPEAQYALKQGNKVIGFATILPLRPNSNKLETLLRSETVSQANITADDIETFTPGKRIHLYISAIGIKPNVGINKKRRYGATLVSGLIKTIINLGRKGVIIEDISAVGATHSGIRLLQTFGLHEIPPRAEGKRAFTMNVEESGSPLSMQYKQALEESPLAPAPRDNKHQPAKRNSHTKTYSKTDSKAGGKPRTMADTSRQNDAKQKMPSPSTSRSTEM